MEGAVREALAEPVREAVEAVGSGRDLVRLRREAEAAAAEIAERVACIHERDLAGDFADLPERVGGFLGVLESPEAEAGLLMAAEQVERRDRAMNAIALERFRRDLTDAYCAPVSERQERAQGVVEAERERLVGQQRARVGRAAEYLLAAVRLPDVALDASAGGGV